MTFDEFQASAKGQRVQSILAEHDWQVEMVCLSKHGLPAAQAVGAEIGAQVGSLSDAEKQHAGRAIREVMAAKGWRVKSRGNRVSPGNFFNRAAIYERSTAP